MTEAHLSLNRPVHLARRDAFFEKAVELLCAPIHEMDTVTRLRYVQQVMSLLKYSKNHTEYAARSPLAIARERDFQHFLELMSQNVQSVYAMMLNQSHLEEEESFLCQFLGTNQQECALPAMAYGRRAEDILQGLWHVLQYAIAPYRSLQKENLEAMNDTDKNRYERASRSIREELQG